MKVIGIVGWKNSGKTTLVTKLVANLTAKGVKVSTVKHAHHDFDVDHEGRDSHRHRSAGASEVLISSARRWALMHELRGQEEPDLDALLARLSKVDLVIVEGFKTASHEKIEVVREKTDEPLLADKDPNIVAIASAVDLRAGDVPVLNLSDVEEVAGFICSHCHLRAAPMTAPMTAP